MGRRTRIGCHEYLAANFPESAGAPELHPYREAAHDAAPAADMLEPSRGYCPDTYGPRDSGRARR